MADDTRNALRHPDHSPVSDPMSLWESQAACQQRKSCKESPLNILFQVYEGGEDLEMHVCATITSNCTAVLCYQTTTPA